MDEIVEQLPPISLPSNLTIDFKKEAVEIFFDKNSQKTKTMKKIIGAASAAPKRVKHFESDYKMIIRKVLTIYLIILKVFMEMSILFE